MKKRVQNPNKDQPDFSEVQTGLAQFASLFVPGATAENFTVQKMEDVPLGAREAAESILHIHNDQNGVVGSYHRGYRSHNVPGKPEFDSYRLEVKFTPPVGTEREALEELDVRLRPLGSHMRDTIFRKDNSFEFIIPDGTEFLERLHAEKLRIFSKRAEKEIAGLSERLKERAVELGANSVEIDQLLENASAQPQQGAFARTVSSRRSATKQILG